MEESMKMTMRCWVWKILFLPCYNSIFVDLPRISWGQFSRSSFFSPRKMLTTFGGWGGGIDKVSKKCPANYRETAQLFLRWYNNCETLDLFVLDSNQKVGWVTYVFIVCVIDPLLKKVYDIVDDPYFFSFFWSGKVLGEEVKQKFFRKVYNIIRYQTS